MSEPRYTGNAAKPPKRTEIVLPVPVHEVPETSGDVSRLISSSPRMHILDETCWCNPTVAYVGNSPSQVFHHDPVAAVSGTTPTEGNDHE